jgi:hypothetical protein
MAAERSPEVEAAFEAGARTVAAEGLETMHHC